MDWTQLSILVTGGTGSFGRKLVEILVRERHPKRLIIFSRDELKQHEMRQQFPDTAGSPLRYFIGDVCEGSRLRRAMHGVGVEGAPVQPITSLLRATSEQKNCDVAPLSTERT